MVEVVVMKVKKKVGKNIVVDKEDIIDGHWSTMIDIYKGFSKVKDLRGRLK
jgi:hypothetical protein